MVKDFFLLVVLLSENGSHKIIYFGYLVPSGTVWEELGFMAILEEVRHWGVEVSKFYFKIESLQLALCLMAADQDVGSQLDMVVYAFNPKTQEVEAGGSLWVWGQLGLQREFQDSQNYTEKPYPEKPETKTNKQTKNKNPTNQTKGCKLSVPLLKPCLPTWYYAPYHDDHGLKVSETIRLWWNPFTEIFK